VATKVYVAPARNFGALSNTRAWMVSPMTRGQSDASREHRRKARGQ